ncbi:MAG: hypothetical protein KAQ92_02085 [Candidatus Aenigmarchaeota archaeon]|nr:hypothetical protein [Candidatus Aenigmarchaeota archaeon]
MSENEANLFFCQLLENNKRIAEEKQDLLQKYKSGQKPKIALITCSDSRMPLSLYGNLEDMMGNVFVGKDIGNTYEYCDAVVDYAVLHLNIPILVILGHTDCGAVKAAAGDFQNETDAIKERLNTIKESFADKENHIECVENNVHSAIDKINEKYKDKINSNELYTVGCVCDTSGAYDQLCGLTYIININGIKDKETIKSHKLLESMKEDLKEKTIAK